MYFTLTKYSTDFTKNQQLLTHLTGFFAEKQHIAHDKADTALAILIKEVQQFVKTMANGHKKLTEILVSVSKKSSENKKEVVTGADTFLLYDTYGFPLELTMEIASQQ